MTMNPESQFSPQPEEGSHDSKLWQEVAGYLQRWDRICQEVTSIEEMEVMEEWQAQLRQAVLEIGQITRNILLTYLQRPGLTFARVETIERRLVDVEQIMAALGWEEPAHRMTGPLGDLSRN